MTAPRIAQNDREQAKEARHGIAGEMPARRTILIVDDNPDAIAVLMMFLQRQGHATYHAADGPAALRLARTIRPDVVFLDIGLPQVSGYEVARELRREAGAHAPRIIAVTGFGKHDDREQAMAAGFDQYLVKPIDLQFVESLLGH